MQEFLRDKNEVRAHAGGRIVFRGLLLGAFLSVGWLHADTLPIAGLLAGTHGTFTMSVPEGSAFWELLIGVVGLVVVDAVRRRLVRSKTEISQQLLEPGLGPQSSARFSPTQSGSPSGRELRGPRESGS